MRTILQHILDFLARRVLDRYRPSVIGITGSVGKTSTKEATATVLERSFHARKSPMTLNDEIGVPMSILDIPPAGTHLSHATWRSRWGVVTGLWNALWLAYGPWRDYPKFLILEMGADKPGEIDYLTKLVRPAIAVVTAVGEIPVHVEFYPDAEAVAREKAMILQFAKPPLGLSVLNADDPRVLAMRSIVPGPVMTFGFSEGADVRASDASFFLSDDHVRVGGLSFTVHVGKQMQRIQMPNLIGVHQISSLLAAICVGMHLGMTLNECLHALESYRSPEKRMAIARGTHDTWIIDDTYNASPLSMHAALNSLKQYPGKRKVAILGEMRELGRYTQEAHEKIEAYAKGCADVVILVGDLWGSGRTASSEEAVRPLIMKTIQPGDIVLVKGSRAMHMEKIVEVLKASDKL